jgi:transposase-like protein
MSRDQNEIIAELQSLCTQYKAEVPGRSQAWPKSIKSRVMELSLLGVGDTEMARLVPIPAQTIYSWRRKSKKSSEAKRSSFVPMKIVEPATVTVKKLPASSQTKSMASTVTVTTPQGYKVEGLSCNDVLLFLSQIERNKNS